MRKLKNISVRSFLLGLVLAFSGCNSWLDIDPVGVQTSDTYWQTKEEAEQVLMAAYIQLRSCMPSFFKWGEIRADELDFGLPHNVANDNMTLSERQLRSLDIRPSNALCTWSQVYTAIGEANAVIRFAPLALETDITFSKELCNSYIAEAVFIRSLCYFYLVRTFRDVPHITEPYADDSQDFAMDVTDGNLILEKVIADLEKYCKMCKPGYEVEWQTKGRATSWAFYALMADIYLWQENYAKVHEMYQRLVAGGFTLVEKKEYWKLFYPGNCVEESIFELQFRGNLDGQKNDLFGWFSNGHLDGRYVISTESKDLFTTAVEDIRGEGYMFDPRYIGEKYWKYVGSQARNNASNPESYMRPQNDRSPNWIFYRFADVVLMEAEAMAMDGTPYKNVCEFIDSTVRKRAGDTQASIVPETESEMLTFILNERQKELLAEGKRWFDLLRVARKKNYAYRDMLVNVLVKRVSAKDRAMWKLKLEDEYSHYLPISKSEIEASHGKLTQNPFYKNVE